MDSINAYVTKNFSYRALSERILPVIQCKVKSKVICLPTEHQGVHKNSARNVRAFQDRIVIWKCTFLRRGGGETLRGGAGKTGVLGETL